MLSALKLNVFVGWVLLFDNRIKAIEWPLSLSGGWVARQCDGEGAGKALGLVGLKLVIPFLSLT